MKTFLILVVFITVNGLVVVILVPIMLKETYEYLEKREVCCAKFLLPCSFEFNLKLLPGTLYLMRMSHAFIKEGNI